MNTPSVQAAEDFRCILVPVDFSPCSHAAVKQAVALCRGDLGKLHIVHVAEPFHPSWKTESADLQRQHRAELHAHLEEFMRSEFPDAKKPHRMMVSGHPAQEILNRADEMKADLIVLGTHGRSGIKRMMMGSVAEKVVRMAHCAVFVVR